jgi:pyruvate kinase
LGTNFSLYARGNTYADLKCIGVIHILFHANTIDEMLIVVENALMSSQTLQLGQQVVLICGFPVNEVRPTNLVLLHTIGEH